MRERWFGRAVLRRLPGLLVGLVLFGVGIAVMAASGLGLGPWEAFHQGSDLEEPRLPRRTREAGQWRTTLDS